MITKQCHQIFGKNGVHLSGKILATPKTELSQLIWRDALPGHIKRISVFVGEAEFSGFGALDTLSLTLG